ncbi:MAG: L-threonylcarbamoyladenylate synthase [Thermodesulfobacteriota bacterium]
MTPEKIVYAKTPEERTAGLERACMILRAGGLVAFPTESFYGLAVDIRREDAVCRLFKAKGRSPDQPVLLLLPSLESVKDHAAATTPAARRLMGRFWPGGLTLVFKAARTVSPLLTAGTGTIGLRLSSHSLATGLALTLGTAITGTSANPSGVPPACTAEEAVRSLGPHLDLILDGGRTAGGPGSTVLDVTVDPPRILRHGQVDRDSLKSCLAN